MGKNDTLEQVRNGADSVEASLPSFGDRDGSFKQAVYTETK